jgi:hypothetical protein
LLPPSTVLFETAKGKSDRNSKGDKSETRTCCRKGQIFTATPAKPGEL